MANDMDTPMDPAGDPVGGAGGEESWKECKEHGMTFTSKEEYDAHVKAMHGEPAAPGADTPGTTDVPPQ